MAENWRDTNGAAVGQGYLLLCLLKDRQQSVGLDRASCFHHEDISQGTGEARRSAPQCRALLSIATPWCRRFAVGQPTRRLDDVGTPTKPHICSIHNGLLDAPACIENLPRFNRVYPRLMCILRTTGKLPSMILFCHLGTFAKVTCTIPTPEPDSNCTATIYRRHGSGYSLQLSQQQPPRDTARQQNNKKFQSIRRTTLSIL